MMPGWLRFLKTETVLWPCTALATAKSGWPSPSKSPMTVLIGWLSARKCTGGAKESAFRVPGIVLMFR